MTNESNQEDDSLKKMSTRVPIEWHTALKAFSDGENRWEARVLRRIIKDWMAGQGLVVQGQLSSYVQVDKATERLPQNPAQELKRKKRANG